MAHTTGPNRVVASSIVSSQMLAAVAALHGVEAITTLTGFKWVSRPIVDRPDATYVLGYEEALGYCVGSLVRDKDGISAALVAAEMVAELKAQGRTVWDELDRLAAEVGCFETGPVTVRFDQIERRSELMANVISAPPTTLAGGSLESLEDLSEGRTLPPTTGALLRFDDQTRIIVRPSGTEPKLKAYIEVFEPAQNTNMAAARVRATTRLSQVQDQLRRYFEES
ncbi:MAG: hypothetical protein R2706_10980 [Acidimicrobiales bacterium]